MTGPVRPDRLDKLPNPLPAFARYQPCRWSGDQLHVSGQVAAIDRELIHRGRVGGELTLAAGQECARQCARNVLALLQSELGDLRRVVDITKATVFVACAPGFSDPHLVADGASEVFTDYLGAAGGHARSAIGVAALPMGSPVEVEVTALVGD